MNINIYCKFALLYILENNEDISHVINVVNDNRLISLLILTYAVELVKQ